MAPKSQPLSLRLSPELDKLVTEEARRTKRSKGAVVESLADEAMKARRLPGIAFRGDDWDRRPWLIGTALDVWQLVQAWQDFGSVERMVEESDLTERQIRLALAYYEQFPKEIDEAIAENRTPIDELLRRYPEFDVIWLPD